jgi:hypothetical protein
MVSVVRRKDFPASEVCSVTERGIVLIEKLKEVFPEKSGEQAGWNFRKQRQTFLLIEMRNKAGNLRRGMVGIEPTQSKS